MRWAQGRAYSLLAGWAGSGSWALGMVVTMRVSVRWREGKGGGWSEGVYEVEGRPLCHLGARLFPSWRVQGDGIGGYCPLLDAVAKTTVSPMLPDGCECHGYVDRPEYR